MSIPLAVQPIIQTGNDCAIASLAMFLGLPYAQVAASAVTVAPQAFDRGMWCTEIQRTSKRLGVQLVQRRRFNVDEDTGILCLDLPCGSSHALVLFRGVLINSDDGMVWDPDAYQAKNKAVFRVLLVPKGTM